MGIRLIYDAALGASRFLRQPLCKGGHLQGNRERSRPDHGTIACCGYAGRQAARERRRGGGGAGLRDPHPLGFVCASTACEAQLMFYREHPQGDTVPLSVDRAGDGADARHDEGCESRAGRGMTRPENQKRPLRKVMAIIYLAH